MERMIEYYTASDAYAEFLQRCDRAEYKPYVDMFRHFVKPAEGQVLDVGCGVGTSTVMLRHRGFEAIGADVSPRSSSHSAARSLSRMQACANFGEPG